MDGVLPNPPMLAQPDPESSSYSSD